MKGQEDAFWRDAAAELGLECVDHDGAPVPRRRATRDDTLRGTIDEHPVSLSYGLAGHAHGLTVISVRTRRPLLLGLEIRSSAASYDARGRRTYPERMTVEGIDRAHVDTLFATPPRGPEILRVMERFGKLGWALLDDTRLQTQIDDRASEGWPQLTRTLVRAVTLAEEACDALGPSPWAAGVLASMIPVAATLGLQVDAATLAVRGRHRDCPIALTTEWTKKGYTFVCRADLPASVDKKVHVERRTDTWSRVLAMLGGRTLERAFRIAGPKDWITPDLATALTSAPERMDVRIERRKLIVREAVIDADVGAILRLTVSIIDGIAGPAGGPYR